MLRRLLSAVLSVQMICILAASGPVSAFASELPAASGSTEQIEATAISDEPSDSSDQGTEAENAEAENTESAPLAEGTYAPGEVIVMFRPGAVRDAGLSLNSARKLDNVDENFGETMKATGDAKEAAMDAKSEEAILRDILGEDFVLMDSIAFDDELTVALVSSDTYDTAEMIRKLSADDRIASAEANCYKESQSYDYDYSLNDQMNAYNYQANTPLAHNQSGTDVTNRGSSTEIPLSTNSGSIQLTEEEKEKEIVVAVLDSGLLEGHEDLKNILWENPGDIGLVGEHGYDFFHNNTVLNTNNPHGTHVSGTIAAEAGNGIGIAGTGTASGANVKIMMLCTEEAGEEYENNNEYRELGAFNYILKAKQRGVNIVATSNSWSGSGGMSTIYDAIIDRLGEEGIVSFFAAGNDTVDLDNGGSDTPSSGDSPYKVVVGAASVSGLPAPFTNYGKSTVDIFGPGEDVLSTVNYRCYFPNIYSRERRNDTTEYYGLFNKDMLISQNSDGTASVTPSKGDTGDEVKGFGESVFHAQAFGYDYGESGEIPGGSKATYELTVAENRFFTDSENPASLKLTIHDPDPDEKYFFYFPYEKNPATTGENTQFSIYVMNSLEEGDTGYALMGGEVIVDADGNCKLYNYGIGPQDPISELHCSNTHICVTQIKEGYPRIIDADDPELEGKTTGIGICLIPEKINFVVGDIHLYLDSVALSKPDPEIPEGSAITPETSYDIMSGTSMATPACAGAYAAYAACHPMLDGETGSEYALRNRAGFLSCVTRTDELKDLCATGGFIDLTHMDEENPVITDAVCDIENNTLTIYGKRLSDGYSLRYRKIEDESGTEVALPAADMDIRFSDDGKTAVITNAGELFNTYIEFLLYDNSSVRAVNSFFLVKGQKELQEVYREGTALGNTDRRSARKLFTDTKGQALYGFEPESGKVYKYDGKQFNVFHGTDLTEAARSFMMKEKGLDEYGSLHDLTIRLETLKDVICTENRLYHFVEITHTQGSETLENGEERFYYLASLDYTADKPAWSFTKTRSQVEVFGETICDPRYAAMNGKIYGISGVQWEDGADKPRTSLVYSCDPTSGEWSREADLPANLQDEVVAVKDDKLYMMLGADYTDESKQKIVSRKAYCFDGSEWTTLNDVPFSGKHGTPDGMGNVATSAVAVCAPVKNGFIFFNCAADGYGNTFLFDPDTGEGGSLYYTFSDFKADVWQDSSAVETKDGVYFLYQYSNQPGEYLVLCVIPRNSGEYESSYDEEPEPAPEPAVTPSLNFSSARLKAGDTLVLKVTGATVTKWASSDSKVATVTKGLVKALKKGEATLTATLDTGETLKCTVIVATSPELGEKSITIRKGSSKFVAIVGRAPGTDNEYRSTDIAQIVSEKAVSTIKVQGLKAGTTTLKVRVNGVWLELAVTVK